MISFERARLFRGTNWGWPKLRMEGRTGRSRRSSDCWSLRQLAVRHLNLDLQNFQLNLSTLI